MYAVDLPQPCVQQTRAGRRTCGLVICHIDMQDSLSHEASVRRAYLEHVLMHRCRPPSPVICWRCTKSLSVAAGVDADRMMCDQGPILPLATKRMHCWGQPVRSLFQRTAPTLLPTTSRVSQVAKMSSVSKIKVANPVVELDGDEMTVRVCRVPLD